jgi:hypothetical protein
VDPDRVTLLDLDHVLTNDGQIYRVVGNLESQTHFLGYNVYSPCIGGDRLYRSQRYKKNFIEDATLPTDVLDTYRLVPIKDIAEHRDPVISAGFKSSTFRSTIWLDLYTELAGIFGHESVGIFGSSMFGLHLTPEGHIRKDVDFVIQGIENVELLRQHLPKIREKLGFTMVTAERQAQQYARYRNVFRNKNNSLRPIIARRWTGVQLSDRVVSTIRLRDASFTTSVELVTPLKTGSPDIVVSGRVVGADGGNLFPRRFGLVTPDGCVDIHILWWKFSTPVCDDDAITLCGSLVPDEIRRTVRLTNFAQHWLRIDD